MSKLISDRVLTYLLMLMGQSSWVSGHVISCHSGVDRPSGCFSLIFMSMMMTQVVVTVFEMGAVLIR